MGQFYFVDYVELLRSKQQHVLVDNTDPLPSTLLSISHSADSLTPDSLLADLSTECAFKFIENQELVSNVFKSARTEKIPISNNHFDGMSYPLVN